MPEKFKKEFLKEGKNLAMKEEGIPFDVDHLFRDFRNYQTKLGIKSNKTFNLLISYIPSAFMVYGKLKISNIVTNFPLLIN